MRDKRCYLNGVGVAWFSAIIAALATGVSVSFPTAPQETAAKIAGQCIERGHQVVDMTPNQVKCQVAVSHEQRGRILFQFFHQRRYTDQVRMFVGFTVVPTADGSIVQPRQWVEATIGGDVRTHDLGGASGAVDGLVSLGGVLR